MIPQFTAYLETLSLHSIRDLQLALYIIQDTLSWRALNKVPLVCKLPLLARALGLKAEQQQLVRVSNVRVSCIQT